MEFTSSDYKFLQLNQVFLGTSINDVQLFQPILTYILTMSDDFLPIKSDIWGLFWKAVKNWSP